MNEAEWLDFLRKNPGQYASAHALYDMIFYEVMDRVNGKPSQARAMVENIANLLSAFHARVCELRE